VRRPQILKHEPQVQADVGEHERFEQYVDRVPHVPFLQPGLVTGVHRAAADDEPGHHHREHPGCVHLLGEDERRERHHQALHRLQGGVGQPPADPQRHVSQHRTDQRPEHRAVGEQQQRVLDERVAARHLRDRDGEQGQCGRIVDQALAGQDRHDPLG
jgi:hypothetical protein